MQGDFQLGEWLVQPLRGRLESSTSSVQIEPKAMDLLVFLASHANRVVTKQHLMDSVWHGAFVTDEVLSNSIYKLRQALEDDPKNPSFIRTIPRRGYQLIAAVRFEQTDEATAELAGYPTVHESLEDQSRQDVPTISIPFPPVFRRWPGVAGVVVVLLAALVGLDVGRVQTSWFRGGASSTAVLILPFEVRGQVEGADYVGRAFAQALAVNLALAPGLKVLPIPQVGEGDVEITERAQLARALGAGLILEGALTREDKSVEVSVSVLGADENRVLWGTRKRLEDDRLPELASFLAAHVASRLGAPLHHRYEYFLYASGSPQMAASPEFAAARGALVRLEEERALETTHRLVETFPNEPIAVTFRAWALTISARGPDPSPTAYAAWEEGLVALDRLDPSSPWTDFFRGHILAYTLRKPAQLESVEIYSKILERSDLSHSARAFLLSERADCRFDLPDLAAARADLDEAIQLDPTHGDFFTKLGNISLRTGRLPEALTRFEQAVALNPGSGLLQTYLGWALLYLDRYEDSLEPLSTACAAGWGCTMYGKALSLAGRTGEALNLLAALCNKNEHGRDCRVYATALARAGHLREGQAVADRVLANPQTYDDFRYLAQFLAVSGDRTAALDALRHSTEIGRTGPLFDAANLSHAFDPDLAMLRGDPEFEAIVGEWRKRWEAP